MKDSGQYVVYYDHPSAPKMYSIRYFDGINIVGVQKAAHDLIEAVRIAIPTTHVLARHPQERPVVEVWIAREIGQ